MFSIYKRLKNFFRELKRRNIYKVAVTYGLTGWIIIQVATNVFPVLEMPEWTTKFVILLVLIGFPIALVFAWAFEITPEGIQRTRDVPEEASISHETGRSLNYWIIGLLSLAVVLLAAERIWWAGTYHTSNTSGSQANTVEQQPSVAVLPFDDYSPDKDQQWFADGLAEELLNSLARLPGLKVTAKNSSFYYRDKDIPLHQVADTLNVNHIVEGSVRRHKDDLRVTAQLIRTEDRSHLWSKTYDRHVDSVFAIQEDIAESIASALDVYLNEDKRRRMFMFGTRNVRAYEAYLKGMELYGKAHGSGEDIDLLWKANTWFEKATSMDPGFAVAHFSHSDAYYHMISGLLPPPSDSLSNEKAHELMLNDLNNAIRHSDTTGLQFKYQLVRTYFSDDWSSVDHLIRKLAKDEKLQRKYVRSCCSWEHNLLLVTGHAQLAVSLLKRVIKRDPNSKSMRVRLANSYFMLGRKDTALDIYEKIRIRNVSAMLYKKLFALLEAGRVEEAKSLEQRVVPQWPSLVEGFKGNEVSGIKETDYNLKLEKGLAYFAAGNNEQASRIAREVDSSQLGPQQLMELTHIMGGIIPFSKSTIPNFYERLNEAGVDVKPYTFTIRDVYKIVQETAVDYASDKPGVN